MMPTWRQVLRAVQLFAGERIIFIEKKREGTLYILCPFHREKSPSCVLRDGYGEPWYVCYGCKSWGSMVDFLAWFGVDIDDVSSTTDDHRQERLL